MCANCSDSSQPFAASLSKADRDIRMSADPCLPVLTGIPALGREPPTVAEVIPRSKGW